MRRAVVAKTALWALALLVFLALGTLVWALQQHPSLQPYADLRWKAPSSGGATPSLKVTFLGLSTVLLDDGETALMTDGFFSRPGKLQTFLGRVEPDLQAITQGLQRAGIPGGVGKLAAVIPVHSHYDHVMDAPEVARRTGAAAGLRVHRQRVAQRGPGRVADPGGAARRAAAVWPLHPHALPQPPCAHGLCGWRDHRAAAQNQKSQPPDNLNRPSLDGRKFHSLSIVQFECWKT